MMRKPSRPEQGAPGATASARQGGKQPKSPQRRTGGGAPMLNSGCGCGSGSASRDASRSSALDAGRSNASPAPCINPRCPGLLGFLVFGLSLAAISDDDVAGHDTLVVVKLHLEAGQGSQAPVSAACSLARPFRARATAGATRLTHRILLDFVDDIEAVGHAPCRHARHASPHGAACTAAVRALHVPST